VSRHRLESDGDEIRFDFATTGTDLAQVLGAVYALERLAGEHRRTIAPLLDRATRWRGPIGASLIQHLAGARSSELSALADPRGWAMNILGLDPTGPTPDRRDIMRCYRARMREIHPDHGGDSTDASTSIIELNEARRILTNPLVAVTPGAHSADRSINVVQVFEFAMSCLWKCPHHHDGKQLTESQQRHHASMAPARIEEHAGTQ